MDKHNLPSTNKHAQTLSSRLQKYTNEKDTRSQQQSQSPADTITAIWNDRIGRERADILSQEVIR